MSPVTQPRSTSRSTSVTALWPPKRTVSPRTSSSATAVLHGEAQTAIKGQDVVGGDGTEHADQFRARRKARDEPTRVKPERRDMPPPVRLRTRMALRASLAMPSGFRASVIPARPGNRIIRLLSDGYAAAIWGKATRSSAPIMAPDTTVMPPTTASRRSGNAERVPVRRLKSSLPTVPFHPARRNPPIPAIAGGEREDLDLGERQVEAQRRARGRAVLHRLQPAPEFAAPKRDRQPGQQHEHRGDGDEVRLVAAERVPSGERLAVGRESVDLAEHVLLYQQREGHRAQCEVEIAQAQARKRDDRADQAGEDGRDHEPDRGRRPLTGQPRRREHPQSGERELSQRDLARVADQQRRATASRSPTRVPDRPPAAAHRG